MLSWSVAASPTAVTRSPTSLAASPAVVQMWPSRDEDIPSAGVQPGMEASLSWGSSPDQRDGPYCFCEAVDLVDVVCAYSPASILPGTPTPTRPALAGRSIEHLMFVLVAHLRDLHVVSRLPGQRHLLSYRFPNRIGNASRSISFGRSRPPPSWESGRSWFRSSSSGRPPRRSMRIRLSRRALPPPRQRLRARSGARGSLTCAVETGRSGHPKITE